MPSGACSLVQSSVRSGSTAVTGSAIPVRRCLSARPSGLPSDRRGWMVLISSHAPLVEFRCPSGPLADVASRSPQAPAPPVVFRTLWHMPVIEVRLPRALPARHLPSAGFDYPLDGLLPRSPGRPYFRPTAPVGFSLRSLLLTGGCRTFLPGPDPLAVTTDLASTN
jgi:hypothetical protein